VLAARNPAAKLGAALVVSLAMLSTLDPLTGALFLALELATVPLFGLSPVTLARRTWPLLLTVAGVVVAQIVVAHGNLATTVGIGLRVLAVALPGVLVFATTDPTDLADALVQNVRLPARFAIGALAAFRLVPLLRQEYRLLGLARRARGIDAGRNPYRQVRLAVSVAFALLVGAVRRGTRLATAMDARGFDAHIPRTVARVQRFRTADAALVLGAALAAAAILTVSVALGFFHPALG
jgi:energy-coupling factor transport system permease protein